MGNGFSESTDARIANYHDVLLAIDNPRAWMLINTLPPTEQSCLIATTLSANQEERRLNALLEKNILHRPILLYGKHAQDTTVARKHAQLRSLGFQRIFIYPGGLFEWTLLRAVRGASSFRMTVEEEVAPDRFAPTPRARDSAAASSAGSR